MEEASYSVPISRWTPLPSNTPRPLRLRDRRRRGGEKGREKGEVRLGEARCEMWKSSAGVRWGLQNIKRLERKERSEDRTSAKRGEVLRVEKK